MSQYKWIALIIVLGLIATFKDNLKAPTPSVYSFLSWNVQNLSLSPPKRNRSLISYLKSYQERLARISQTIMSLSHLPDVIAFQEWQDAQSLKDFQKNYLHNIYRYAYYPSPLSKSNGLVFLSRVPVEQYKIMYTTSKKLRPILIIQLKLANKLFILINNHWKSRKGGVLETYPRRKLNSQLLHQTWTQLYKKNPQAYIIALGDFNEYFSSIPNTIQYNLPLSPNNQAFAAFIPDPLSFAISPQGAMWDICPSQNTKGSYFYQENWYFLDHIFINELFWKNEKKNATTQLKCYIISTQASRSFIPNNQFPRRWNGYSGTSDHFALYFQWIDKKNN